MSDLNPQPSENVCDVCGGPAELHVTTIEKGQVSVRHLCREHHLLAQMAAQLPFSDDTWSQKGKWASRSLGTDPKTGLPVYFMIGPFGPCVQLGEATEDGAKPNRVTIPKHIDAQHITIAQALDLLSLPRTLGNHPVSGKPIKAGIGRFGPYVIHEEAKKVYKSLPKKIDEFQEMLEAARFDAPAITEMCGKVGDVFRIDLATAIELLKLARTRGAATPLRELGAHPEDGQPVQVFSGKYGPYVKHGKVNATIPKETPVDTITLPQALALLDRAGRDVN
jgi:DNA topoisomerase-1